MSASNYPVNDIRALMDPITTPKHYVDIVKIPNEEVFLRRVAATSSGSTLSWNFANLPCGAFLDRKIDLDFQATFTFTATQVHNDPVLIFPNGGAISPSGAGLDDRVGLRYLPVLSNASNIEIVINGKKVSYSANRFLEPLSRFNGGDVQESLRLSDTPCLHDWGRYTGAAVAYGGTSNLDTSPYRWSQSPVANSRLNAARYNVSAVVAGVNGPNAGDVSNPLTTIIVNWTETLFLSPLTDFEGQGGFYDISTIGININMSDQYQKYWSTAEAQIVPATAGYVVTGNFVANQQFMRLYTITPPVDDVNCGRMLPSYGINLITTQGGPIANKTAANDLLPFPQPTGDPSKSRSSTKARPRSVRAIPQLPEGASLSRPSDKTASTPTTSSTSPVEARVEPRRPQSSGSC